MAGLMAFQEYLGTSCTEQSQQPCKGCWCWSHKKGFQPQGADGSRLQLQKKVETVVRPPLDESCSGRVPPQQELKIPVIAYQGHLPWDSKPFDQSGGPFAPS